VAERRQLFGDCNAVQPTPFFADGEVVWNRRPVTRRGVEATRVVEQHALGLQAGDALHLAICADHGATLCTLDRLLSDAASALGLKTMLL
jgi:predicted nucleic acid-binding protein